MKGSLPARAPGGPRAVRRRPTSSRSTRRGQPVVWPLTPRYHGGAGCIDVTVARRVVGGERRRRACALLFSDGGRWCSCRARPTSRTRRRGDRRPRAAPSASTPGPATTSRPSPSSTTRTSTRSARRTTRSPRSATRRPRAAAACGTSASTSSAPDHPTLSWPSSAPTASPSPSASRCAPTARRASCSSRPIRSARRSSPAWPACARTRPVGAASTCSATSRRTAGGWVLRPAPVADPATPPRALMAGLTVAVTGPTGEIGRAFMRSLERSREVGRIVGMARRPFDPAAHGWKRTEYRRGDVLDRASVEGLVEGADVVVHLAFVVLKASSETRHVNVEGSRNVFEAAVAGGCAAAGLLELGRRLRLPRGPGRAHHRGRAGRRPRAPPLLRAQGRGRGGPRRRAERRRDRRVGLPALHRRRARRAGADRSGALARAPARPAGRAGRRRRRPARPGRALPARPPRRRRHRAARRRPRPRRAGRLQPRGRGRDHDARPRRRARLSHRADAQAGRRRDRRARRASCRSCPRRPPGSRPCAGPVLMDAARRGGCCAGARATTRSETLRLTVSGRSR